MGRLPDLMRTLPVNLRWNAAYDNLEFVVLDYNSDDGLGSWIGANFGNYLDSGRVVYYRTEEPEHYSMTHSRNVAFKAATGDIVCNIDADNYTLNVAPSVDMRPAPCFAEHINALANAHGRRRIFGKDPRAMRGRLGFYRDEFIQLLGGYDEDLTGYGYDDHDLYQRALRLGLKFVAFDSTYYSRIHTPKKQRAVNMPDKQWRRTETNNRRLSEARIAAGMLTANHGRAWGKTRLKKNFSEWIDLA